MASMEAASEEDRAAAIVMHASVQVRAVPPPAQ